MLERAIDIPRIRDAAERLRDWLEENVPGASPRRYEAKEPGRGYRRSVEWIVNESTARTRWEETWFEEGIMAFTLIALEAEGVLELKVDDDVLLIHFSHGPKLTPEEFKTGELSPEYKYDDGFRDMNFCCVVCMNLALGSYGDSSG